MSTTPTARTKEACRKLDWLPGVVEKWVSGRNKEACKLCGSNERARSGVRIDLFGFVDLVVLCPKPAELDVTGTIRFIQCTTASSMGTRIDKIMGDEHRHYARTLLRSGGVLEVWGWRKLAKRVDRRAWWAKRVAIRWNDATCELYTYNLEDR